MFAMSYSLFAIRPPGFDAASLTRLAAAKSFSKDLSFSTNPSNVYKLLVLPLLGNVLFVLAMSPFSTKELIVL